MVVGGSVARLPGDLENLEKSENLKRTKIKNLTLKTPGGGGGGGGQWRNGEFDK